MQPFTSMPPHSLAGPPIVRGRHGTYDELDVRVVLFFRFTCAVLPPSSTSVSPLGYQAVAVRSSVVQTG